MPSWWTTAQTERALSAVLDIVKIGGGTVIGAFLAQWQRRRDKREQLKEKFQKLVLRVTACATLNDVPTELQRMRDFVLDECPEFLKSESNVNFFHKWLSNTNAIAYSVGWWNPFRLEQLHADMGTLQTPK